ncbi:MULTISPECIES: RDD family protein [Shewanella]|uniref:RDD family protein n=1 Tax=Shewanella TaxID=22 RepID=UPI001EFD3F9F|nr:MULTISPECIES: RDD family protein [Shewanella]MCG9747113.1 RDD family protein [Shewanella sp. Isolate8]MCL2908662.1 RDD family protein [Shewanella aquimarina]
MSELMDYAPDFSTYSYKELLEAERYINREEYPERYDRVVELLKDPGRWPKEQAEDVIGIEGNKYATFWPRFWAAVIDGLLFGLILIVERLIFDIQLNYDDKLVQALNGVLFGVYSLLMHGYFGQTVGKMIMEVKVVDHLSETDIDLWQAFRRESVNLALSILGALLVAAYLMVMASVGKVSLGLSFVVIGFTFISLSWDLSEFVTMLFNDKRRAVHDFIGKTVVVRI